jgi:hypothetical protein
VTGILRRRPGFIFRPFHVGFAVNKVALGLFYLLSTVTGDPWLETRSRICSVVRQANYVRLNQIQSY